MIKNKDFNKNNMKTLIIKNNRGMTDALTGIALGIVVFILIVGIGLTVLSKINVSVVECPTAFPTQVTGTTTCQNATGSTVIAANAAVNGTTYGITQMGSTGLLGWLPAVIALLIGLLFLGAFLGKRRTY